MVRLLFVSKEKVGVTVDGENVIYILPKMSFGIKQKAMQAMSSISGTDAKNVAVSLNIGAYNLALMKLNIVGWEGPAFKGLSFKPDLIEDLDPDEPLVEKVLEEINRRNTKSKDAPSPNSSDNNGDTSLTA